MSDQDELDEDEPWDPDLFDVETVEWSLPKPKTKSECLIRFYDTDGLSFNLIKIRGSLLKLLYHIDQELNILEESDIQ